ncbi:MAG: ATP-binding cassette domain-containing protein [Prevotella sp.]|nr:ATP-binding cassette domain-containing protein [Prevotella sp.]
MLITYKNVSIRHEDDDNYVLKGVDLEVAAGDLVYLIGKVGSGKSSLIRSFYGEVEVDECDEATVLGNDMFSIKRQDLQPLRRELGIIFQDFKLLTDRNIHKNLEFILKATGWNDKTDREQRISEVLRDVKMEGCENKMPHELSGGEQQRIAIARALLNSPKVLLADEPTGNLDPETTDQIMGVFKEIAIAGTAVIIATHNMAILDKFPGTVYQCEGQNFTKYEN